MNAKRFILQLLMTKTKTVSARALPKGIEVTIYSYGGGRERKQSKRCDPAPQVYDIVGQPMLAAAIPGCNCVNCWMRCES